MKVFMTESTEQMDWIKAFNNGMFCGDKCYFYSTVNDEDTKIYWLIATKRMNYDVAFSELDGVTEVCVTVPTNDITRIEY
jgi:hypothetical protein